jgi:hypothetical protein
MPQNRTRGPGAIISGTEFTRCREQLGAGRVLARRIHALFLSPFLIFFKRADALSS